MAKGKKKNKKNFKPWEYTVGRSAMVLDGQGGDAAEIGTGEASALALPSKGLLQKQQRWEIKALKAKIGNLQKEKLKLSKKEPQQKERRKNLEKQIKFMLEEQKQAHESQLQELQRLKDESRKSADEDSGKGLQDAEASGFLDEFRSSQDAVENANALFEQSRDQAGSEASLAEADVGEDMEMEESSGVLKSKLGRKSLAKKMKKKMKEQKKRAWHLIAKEMGVELQPRDQSLGSVKKKGAGVKLRKRIGRKVQIKARRK